MVRMLTLLLLTLAGPLHARVRDPAPQLINYQGRVAVNGVNFKGAGQFKFALVDPAGTTTYWSNDGTSTGGSEPAAAVILTVTKGRYSVLLGDTTLRSMASMPASVFTHADLRLRVWFNDGRNGSQLLTPDQRIDTAITGTGLAHARDLRVGDTTPTPEAWQPRNASWPPLKRTRTTAVWTGSELIVWGGFFTSDAGAGSDTDEGHRYNPSGKSWTSTSHIAAPVARRYHTAIWTGSEMIVWGGRGGGTALNDGARYNPAADTWTPVRTNGAPTPRLFHSALWTGSEMIVWGGSKNESVTEGGVNDGARYDPAADTWTPVTTTGAPTARALHTAVWTGREMIVWGGYSRQSPQHVLTLDDGGRYNPIANQWTAVSSNGAPEARFFDQWGAFWSGSEMMVWGGEVDGGGRYDPALDAWAAMSTPEGALDLVRGVWTGSEMIAWGGADRGGARYDPALDFWSPMSTTGAPPPGGRPVWTGTEMIVWVGNDDGSSFPHHYHPKTDSWTTAPFALPAPTPRHGHSAVWTGAEMIVWGFAPDGSSGGRYNPAADTWTPVATDAAPLPRTDHTAVWTGAEMIVWGGLVGGANVNDGGRYDPAVDIWMALNSAGAPAARASHTAVWTGREMIVWGGQDGSIPNSYFNDGARYDLAQNKWTPLTAIAAPSARSEHTAVWTGIEMIVWGGRFAVTSLNTGGRYHLAANSWSPVSLTGAPASRAEHTAVWTGSEMIVWGGRNGTTYLKTGGRYDPVGDRWNAMITNGAPSARWGHTSVWTGREMLLWGGTDGFSLFNDTFSYTPGSAGFGITGLIRNGATLTISFPTVAGCTYTLWHSDSLTEGTWIDTGLAPVAGTGAILNFVLPATTPATRFFRVQAEPLDQ